MPYGMEDATKLPKITDALLKRGFSEGDVKKILGENTLRVMAEVERVSREIKDPSSGKVIRRIATTVGVVKVTDVDDISAVATTVSGTGFKTGDAVKTVTQ